MDLVGQVARLHQHILAIPYGIHLQMGLLKPLAFFRELFFIELQGHGHHRIIKRFRKNQCDARSRTQRHLPPFKHFSVVVRRRRHLLLLQVPLENLSGQNQTQFLLGRRELRNRTIAGQIDNSQPITLSCIVRQRQKIHMALPLALIGAQSIGAPAAGIAAITYLQLH
ncbi:MAG: hypothetical protein GAK34_03586 [Delftia tsuruhatensis]|nr:MAG: hypothetical protein GAK34_03586 [Delftia tsuruhatensis]